LTAFNMLLFLHLLRFSWGGVGRCLIKSRACTNSSGAAQHRYRCPCMRVMSSCRLSVTRGGLDRAISVKELREDMRSDERNKKGLRPKSTKTHRKGFRRSEETVKGVYQTKRKKALAWTFIYIYSYHNDHN
jgi:hypothetical protein